MCNVHAEGFFPLFYDKIENEFGNDVTTDVPDVVNNGRTINTWMTVEREVRAVRKRNITTFW